MLDDNEIKCYANFLIGTLNFGSFCVRKLSSVCVCNDLSVIIKFVLSN